MECVVMQHVVCQPPPQNALPQTTFLAVCYLRYRLIHKGLHLVWPLAWDSHLARSTIVSPRLVPVPAQLHNLFGHLLAAFLAQWLPSIQIILVILAEHVQLDIIDGDNTLGVFLR
jgi:hypothetical protein